MGAPARLGRDGGVGLGICGYGEGAESDRAIESAVKAAVGTRPYALVNDVDAAWAAGLNLADGIAVIAGTGSIALGVRNGASMRCGGWDYLLGDEGSGGWLARRPCAPSPAKATGATSAASLPRP